MIIPIGHEQTSVRRLPWITFAILACCFVVQILITSEVRQKNEELEGLAEELMEYYITHPYLELDSEVLVLIFGEQNAEVISQQLILYQNKTIIRTPSDREAEQQNLDEICERLKTVFLSLPYKKWGYTPAEGSATGLLTYMFIHGGILHLLGNLLFLFLLGPFIEDVWGRPLFLVFYIVMGVLSAWLYSQHYPNSMVPLIGASGAIAGVMGAFLIRYWKTKITFFYWFFIFIRGTFKAPAWLMMPLWLLLELLNAKVMDSINPGGGSGIAHWAHVWGFVCGALIAVGVKLFKVEEKYINPRIQAKIHYEDEDASALEEAELRKRLRNFPEAYKILLETAFEHPKNREVIENLWELGRDLGKQHEIDVFLIKLIEHEIRQNQMDQALDHFRNLREVIPHADLNPTYKIALVEFQAERGYSDEADKLGEELIKNMHHNSTPELLMRFARAALKLRSSIRDKAAELVQKNNEIFAEQKEEFRRQLEDSRLRSDAAQVNSWEPTEWKPA